VKRASKTDVNICKENDEAAEFAVKAASAVLITHEAKLKNYHTKATPGKGDCCLERG
jgi:hypothetical protein